MNAYVCGTNHRTNKINVSVLTLITNLLAFMFRDLPYNGGISLLPTCKINYVNMQNNNVNIGFINGNM